VDADLASLLNSLNPTAAFWVGLTALVAMRLQSVLSWIGRVRKTWIQEIRPIFYDEEQLRRANMRKLFARHVTLEIGRLNDQEDWSEQRFAELEAEVEMQSGRRFKLFGAAGPAELRRVRSLSRALAQTTERLILLEGEPGAGKSTALRHVAFELGGRAARSRSTRSLVPAYVNLKGLHVPPGKAVDAAAIRQYVLGVLNRAHNRDVDLFLEDEFDRGLREGTWLFLFDSFDEIPAVLAATSVDDTVRAYEDAISDFLGGLNVCRGIIASREFRGPRRLSWPRMRILALSDKRRAQLVRRASLRGASTREILGNLGLATPEIAAMSRNPLFLALLCEHVRGGEAFPRTNYSVFETYFAARLERDRGRVAARYGVSEIQLREVAEMSAFQMSAAGLGLSPKRDALLDAISAFSPRTTAAACLDALEFIKIARSEETDGARRFTFAHRRFQEYFATRVVLAEPNLVSATELLTDARWRETAVVLLQTQPAESVAPLLAAAERLLKEQWDVVGEAYESTVAGLLSNPAELGPADEPREFPWPESVPHILSALSAGLSGREAHVPEPLIAVASRFVMAAYHFGTVIDRKIAVEVASLLPAERLEPLLRHALTGKSPWVADVAYLQASHLPALPPNIAKEIRKSLIGKFMRRTLWRDRNTVLAHVSRLHDEQATARTARLLIAAAAADDAMVIAGILLLLSPWKWGDHLFLAGLLVFFVIPMVKRTRDLGFFSFMSMCRVLMTILCISFGISEGVMTPALAITVAFLLCWTPMALAAAEAGRYVERVWWPLLPVWPLIAFLAASPAMARWARTHQRQVGQGLFAMSFCVALGLILLMVVPDPPAPTPKTRTVIEVVLTGILAVIAVAAVIKACSEMLRDALAARRDRRRLARLRSLNAIAAAEFVEELSALSNAEARIDFIEEARKNKRIAATAENERSLFALALEVEKVQRPGWRDAPQREKRWEQWQSAVLSDCLYELVMSLRDEMARR
jgi:NACHT domain